MDKKNATPNPKKGNKDKNKRQQQQPLKVVYITNPMKFNATASEFRALVQELTGQDADVSDYSRFAASAAEKGNNNAHATEQVGHSGGGAATPEKGSDLSYANEYGVCPATPEMIDNFEGFAASTLWHS